MLKYSDKIPLNEILLDLQNKGKNKYYACKKPRKLSYQVGRVLYPELKGRIGIFLFQ